VARMRLPVLRSWCRLSVLTHVLSPDVYFQGVSTMVLPNFEGCVKQACSDIGGCAWAGMRINKPSTLPRPATLQGMKISSPSAGSWCTSAASPP